MFESGCPEDEKAFMEAYQAEWERAEIEAGPVRISKWTPRLTMEWDAIRRNKINNHLTHWSIGWWESRGYTVTQLQNGDFEARKEWKPEIV